MTFFSAFLLWLATFLGSLGVCPDDGTTTAEDGAMVMCFTSTETTSSWNNSKKQHSNDGVVNINNGF